MNFGDILSQWERNPQNRRFQDKDRLQDDEAALREAPSIKQMRPQAHLDLHQKTQDDAREALEQFVSACVRRRLRKVLIIHGKGNHPGSEAVLAKLVQEYIRTDPRLGASGHPDARGGGSGATWVAVKPPA
ncbi:MAG: Smr/MutS family protein [Spirochaetaceae bacterium]|jgi:DNA-nicking Smr family endonuclease|nr:Smr/MutS family protein [Spirochaetaceae bacterium]